MSEWTTHLEFEEGISSKFWRARVEGKTLYVNYGKIGSAGQTQVKDFATPAAAQAEFDKLVREKRKKGYNDAGGGGSDDEDEKTDDESDESDEADEADAAPKRVAKPVAKPALAAALPAARPAGDKLVLEAGNRKVETYLSIDGKAVRMESIETYASPEAAKKAHERLKKMLASEGYKA